MNAIREHHAGELSPDEYIVEAATQRCVSQGGRNPNKPETWPSTRDIAEGCNFGIYKTRYFLLKMVAKGRLLVTPHPVRNTLRWYIHPEKNDQDVSDAPEYAASTFEGK
ncbi:FaeA/PapI family transcriptional regulator [Serratia fonticola]